MNRRTALLAFAHAGLLALAGPVAAQRPPHIAHAGRGRIQQLAFGDWSYADGEHKATVLLARYPDTNIIWGSNDSMALGVLRAVGARGAPVLVGGIGGFWDAMVSVADGGLDATAAGDYLIGTWAIVLLHDYHHGHDFAASGGVNQQLDYIYVVHRENVACFNDVILKSSNSLDFTIYSKAQHPQPGRYDFNLKHLMEKANVP